MLKKIIVATQSVIMNFKFFFINVFSKKTITLNPSNQLHVSLTKYHKRLNRVYLTIESICCQSTPPASVTLWLYKGDIKTVLPSSLQRLISRGLIVEYLDENIKSYKKLFYSYLRYQDKLNAKIITVDDDVFYPTDMLSLLQNKYKKNKGVICFRGKYFTFDKDSLFVKYKNWLAMPTDTTNDMHLLPTGVGGVLYPISSLKGLDEHKDTFLDICPTADDIWFKCLTLSNNYPSFRVSDSNFHPTPHLSFNMKGLEKVNVNEGRNDEQLAKVLSFFDIKLH